jgi:hypothetical protein
MTAEKGDVSLAITLRLEASSHLEHAKKYASSQNDDDLVVCAVYLRYSIESLAYYKLAGMQEYYDLPEFSRWEPPRVVRLVNEIDPSAFLNVLLKVSNESGDFDLTSVELRQDGIDTRSIIKNYHKLGQFLHVPAISQREKRKEQFGGLQDLCIGTVELLKIALADEFVDIKVGVNCESRCVKCGGAIRRRMPPSGRRQVVECLNCHIKYDIEMAKSGDVVWSVLATEFACPKADCGAKNRFFEGQAVVGKGFVCRSCGARARFSLTLTEI